MGREKFNAWVEDLVERGGGFRQAARQMEVSHATLMKAAGRVPGEMDLHTIVLLADWAKVPLISVIGMYTDKEVSPDQMLVMELERLRATHPELGDALVIAAELGEDDLREVLSYIKFRVSQKG